MFQAQASAVELLKKEWPTELADWDVNEGKLRSREVYGGPARCSNFPDPASAIMLARKHNIPGILPAAFYCLSMISPLHDWSNKAEDGTIGIKPKDKRWMNIKPQTVYHRCGRWDILGAKELMDLVVGKEQIRCLVKRLRVRLQRKGLKYCEECSNGYHRVVKVLADNAQAWGILRALKSADFDELDGFEDM